MLALFFAYHFVICTTFRKRIMTDFSYLKQVDVKAADTKEYHINQISVAGKTPVLLVTAATEANTPYYNSLLRDAIKNARKVKKGGVSAEMMKKNRDQDRELYPKHVIKGWVDVVDGSGETVPFNAEACADFLSQLPDWIFDDLRNYCSDPTNFVDSFDVELTAKK